ncbi:C4-dicarboxylate TRAP transporter substrate-binding protein [Roseovarius salinarum]|uniref:C4-dicarboxylate TRAP transporter substrate-binding protein n=1 Tax=Roseovarius salinarum TaxID=1981892 RepID=UPI000C345ED0|nr:C4-dicarboxylate TRAP transporter substrate-binding protein [Roseovarius salinarum]
MQRMFGRVAVAALTVAFATEAMATEWNVSLWGKRRAFTEHVEKLAELVEEKSGGDFTLNISYGGLSKPRENLDGISIGAFEMAQFCAGYHRDKNPSITVLELPFLGVETLQHERKLSMALYDHPAAQEDLARWNATLLMPSPLPQYNLVGTGEPRRELSDFEGLSVRATGGIGAAMEALGAVPTSMSATEVRQALDSGVVQAVAFAPHAHMAFGTIETGDWWTTNLNPGTVNCPVVANTDALEGLPDEHREILMGSIDESLDHYIDNYMNNTMERWGPALDERGIERITYSDEAIESFEAAVATPAAQSWIEENAARGLPAQDLYDFVTGKLNELKGM